MTYTVFLDRDGVINRDSPDYIKTPDEFHFLPGSREAIALLSRAGVDVIVITNQSAVGRKMITPAGLDDIFDKMMSGVRRAGGDIKDIFFCPHTPLDGCSCRKPEPGLILRAAKQYSIDLDHACMVGDSAKDIECSVRAGCALSVLVGVDSHHGSSMEAELETLGIRPDLVAENLMDAVVWILETIAGRLPGKS